MVDEGVSAQRGRRPLLRQRVPLRRHQLGGAEGVLFCYFAHLIGGLQTYALIVVGFVKIHVETLTYLCNTHTPL
jgi:hypothetical protein